MSSIITKGISASALVVLLPLTVSAASVSDGIAGVLKTVSDLINMIVPIIIALAIVYFLYGVVTYVIKPEEKGKAINIMIWGIVGIAVMVSIWGLVAIFQNTFGLQGQNSAQTPATVQFNTGTNGTN
ncbi:MAG TPA: hypothetical protein VFL98_00060 [Candidatus Paceibacterota bacterium]|nr:hypothetical protein [Candidatus Paceibacterota bacterium]